MPDSIGTPDRSAFLCNGGKWRGSFAVGYACAVFFLFACAPARPAGWLIQLQNTKPFELKAAAAEIVVIDPDEDWVTPKNLDYLRHGKNRKVIAYIGPAQAETYRAYWRKEWAATPPAWLGKPDEYWSNNHFIRFWDPEWKAILFGNPASTLDTIIGKGFDGIYIDPFGVSYWRGKGVPDSRERLVDLLCEMIDYARGKKADFYVIQQNPGLLAYTRPGFVERLDAVTQEEFYWGYDNRDGVPTPDEKRAAMAPALEYAEQKGRPVMLLEYPFPEHEIGADRPSPETAANLRTTARLAADDGRIVFFGTRKLDRLSPFRSAVD